MSTATKSSNKVECINPNTGGRMNIDATTYEMFSKAIYHTLKEGAPLTFSQIVEGIYDCFKKQNSVVL